jgi:RNase P subunit RPR2
MEFFTNNFINKYLAFSNVNIHCFAVRLLCHKCYALWRPIKLQIHLWTNRKRLSPVEYSCACCGSGAYTSRCMLHLSYATDCRMLLTFVLRSKLWNEAGILNILKATIPTFFITRCTTLALYRITAHVGENS